MKYHQVVGYQNKTVQEYNAANMVAPTFLKVGTEGADAYVTLADFAVTGYDKDDPAVLNGLVITEINGSGVMAKKTIGGVARSCNYTWQDFPGFLIPAGWYDDDGGLMASAERVAELQKEGYEDVFQSYFGDASNISYEAGDGFSVNPSSEYPGIGIKLPSPIGE